MADTRKFWLDTMLKIADPVLKNLAAGALRTAIPTAFHPDRAEYICLEALGRTVCGLALWLETEGLTGEEAKIQRNYRELARQAIGNAVDPASPDFMNFSEGYGQALVDAAFLAHGVLRAPAQLYARLPEKARDNLAAALRTTRKFVPYVSNWLLFSAMIEAALHRMGRECDPVRVEYAVNMVESWYLGDGMYGDGPVFHFDYYNSFVIHPMLLDVLAAFQDVRPEYAAKLEKAKERAARYAALLERLIAPDGSFPVTGRSVSYRFGAFQLLAQAALQGFLPKDLPANQVRCALTAVIQRVMDTGILDKNGFLLPGVAGKQPGLCEGYISVGSLYLCEGVFLPLGLLPENGFWAGPDAPWTGKKIWQGRDMPCDHAID